MFIPYERDSFIVPTLWHWQSYIDFSSHWKFLWNFIRQRLLKSFWYVWLKCCMYGKFFHSEKMHGVTMYIIGFLAWDDENLSTADISLMRYTSAIICLLCSNSIFHFIIEWKIPSANISFDVSLFPFQRKSMSQCNATLHNCLNKILFTHEKTSIKEWKKWIVENWLTIIYHFRIFCNMMQLQNRTAKLKFQLVKIFIFMSELAQRNKRKTCLRDIK